MPLFLTLVAPAENVPSSSSTIGEEVDVEALKKSILLATWVEDYGCHKEDISSLLPLSLPLPVEMPDDDADAKSAGQLGMFAAVVEEMLSPLRTIRPVVASEVTPALFNGVRRRPIPVGAPLAEAAADAARASSAPWISVDGVTDELSLASFLPTAGFFSGDSDSVHRLPLPLDLPLECTPVDRGEDPHAVVRTVLASALETVTQAATSAFSFRALEQFCPRPRRSVQLLRAAKTPGTGGAADYSLWDDPSIDGQSSDYLGGPVSASLPPYIVLKKRPASSMAAMTPDSKAQQDKSVLMRTLLSQINREAISSALHSNFAHSNSTVPDGAKFSARLRRNGPAAVVASTDGRASLSFLSSPKEPMSFEQLLPKSCLFDEQSEKTDFSLHPVEKPAIVDQAASNAESTSTKEPSQWIAPVASKAEPHGDFETVPNQGCGAGSSKTKPSGDLDLVFDQAKTEAPRKRAKLADSSTVTIEFEKERRGAVSAESSPPHSPEDDLLMASCGVQQIFFPRAAAVPVESVYMSPKTNPDDLRTVFFDDLLAESSDATVAASSGLPETLVSDSDLIEGAPATGGRYV